MSKGQVFWVLWLICLFFGASWRQGWLGAAGPWGFGLAGMFLFFLLGWHNFGFVIH